MNQSEKLDQLAPKVYTAIAAVQLAMSKEGIAKGRKNQQQGYAFRGIDDVYAALAPHLAANGLVIIPRVTARETVERQTKAGGALFYTSLTVEFDFVAVADGSKHTACTIGEAMDSGDKSSNKAMSAAYKYACFLAFAIPTEGENDADELTHPTIEPKKPESYKPSGPMLTPDTHKALSALCSDAAMSTKLTSALEKKGLISFTDLSEADGQSLLKWATKTK